MLSRPGGVEGRLIRAGQAAQRAPTSVERVVPGDRHVVIGVRVVAHRFGEPADRLQVVVAPRGELADGVRGEERRVGLRRRQLPGDVLDAVLADVQVQAGRIVGPGTARAVEAAVLLVHHRTSARIALDRLGERAPGPGRRCAPRPNQRPDGRIRVGSACRPGPGRGRARLHPEPRRASAARRRLSTWVTMPSPVHFLAVAPAPGRCRTSLPWPGGRFTASADLHEFMLVDAHRGHGTAVRDRLTRC